MKFMAQDEGSGPQSPAGTWYEVGYGKPPVHTRFSKGQSGNPTGRPRRRTDLASLLINALDRPVVTEGRNGGTQREAIIAALVEKSASGDLRATKLVLDLMRQVAPAAAPSASLAEAPSGSPQDDPRQILLGKLARLADADRANHGDGTGAEERPCPDRIAPGQGPDVPGTEKTRRTDPAPAGTGSRP
jgi:hypothetical protein